MANTIAARLPTGNEFKRMMTIMNSKDAEVHWAGMKSWCLDDLGGEKLIIGGELAHMQDYFPIDGISDDVGFRPAFPILHSDAEEGEKCVFATLFMDGEPVPVPEKPIWCGDVIVYTPGAKLEFREPINDPAFQITAIRAGNVFIADRVLLKQITWATLEKQGFASPTPVIEHGKRGGTDWRALATERGKVIEELQEQLRREKAANQVLRARVFELEMERV